MTLENAMLVFSKDWREIRRNWQVIGPLVIVPMLIAVMLPLVIILIPTLITIPGTSLNIPVTMFENLPLEVKLEIAGMNISQQMTYVFLLYFFAPFFLIIPIMASSVLASDSFAGEKDRKTIEALLATPLTDGELLLGKILVSFIPSMLVTILAFIVYSVVVDVAAFTLFGGMILLPNLLWLVLIFCITPAVSLAGIGITVIVSVKVKGFREAQQLSALLVLPIMLLIFSELGGLIMFGPIMLALLIAGFVVMDLIVF
ncbi:MAG: ABC transporter permease subunit, partial [Candidatus Methanomethyliaceae archaeon]|nr:ABC transporter permease subunit [Candidatus Methanomethyliaceae archaeon]